MQTMNWRQYVTCKLLLGVVKIKLQPVQSVLHTGRPVAYFIIFAGAAIVRFKGYVNIEY